MVHMILQVIIITSDQFFRLFLCPVLCQKMQRQIRSWTVKPDRETSLYLYTAEINPSPGNESSNYFFSLEEQWNDLTYNLQGDASPFVLPSIFNLTYVLPRITGLQGYDLQGCISSKEVGCEGNTPFLFLIQVIINTASRVSDHLRSRDSHWSASCNFTFTQNNKSKHFQELQTKVLRGQVTCQGSHRKPVAGWKIKPGFWVWDWYINCIYARDLYRSIYTSVKIDNSLYHNI